MRSAPQKLTLVWKGCVHKLHFRSKEDYGAPITEAGSLKFIVSSQYVNYQLVGKELIQALKGLQKTKGAILKSDFPHRAFIYIQTDLKRQYPFSLATMIVCQSRWMCTNFNVPLNGKIKCSQCWVWNVNPKYWNEVFILLNTVGYIYLTLKDNDIKTKLSFRIRANIPVIKIHY